jgi:hypothetical protein
MKRNGNCFASIFLLLAFLLLMGYYCCWIAFCSIEACTVVASLLLSAPLLFLTFILLLAFLLLLGFCCCWYPFVRNKKNNGPNLNFFLLIFGFILFSLQVLLFILLQFIFIALQTLTFFSSMRKKRKIHSFFVLTQNDFCFHVAELKTISAPLSGA